jgi:hypothetical protein
MPETCRCILIQYTKNKQCIELVIVHISLRVTGSATGNFREKNSRAKLRLPAVYFTVLSTLKQLKAAEVKNKLHENFINSVALNVKVLILGLQ